MPAALTVAAGAALSSPLAAQAAVTPSLKNLINSVIAGVLAWCSSLQLIPVSSFNIHGTVPALHCASVKCV